MQWGKRSLSRASSRLLHKSSPPRNLFLSNYFLQRNPLAYVYRTVDKQGQTADFLFSEHRDLDAAKRLFKKASDRYGSPEKITLDAYETAHRAI
jgi:hypothetical protein